LADLFSISRDHLFGKNPREDLQAYQRFTEASLLVDVSRWPDSPDLTLRGLGKSWARLLKRDIRWKMVCQRTLLFAEQDAEQSSIFTDSPLVETRLRQELPGHLQQMGLRVDIAWHIYRPHTLGPAAGQNYLYDGARQRVRPLQDHQLFRHLPTSHRLCRIYAEGTDYSDEIARALDRLLGPGGGDDLTNM